MDIDESFDAYKETKNVIERLLQWKDELESELKQSPKSSKLYAEISEIELAVNRLKVLAQTEIFNDKVTVQQLECTADDYDYRLMCEWGYKNREKWKDAKVGTKKVKVESGTYIINK